MRLLLSALVALGVILGAVTAPAPSSTAHPTAYLTDNGQTVTVQCLVAVGQTCVPTTLLGGGALPAGYTAPTCHLDAIVSVATTCTEVITLPGDHRGGDWFPPRGGYHDGYGDGRGHYGGHYVFLRDGTSLDVCGSGNYADFLDDHPGRAGEIGSILSPNPAASYDRLRDNCVTGSISTSVSPDGNCTTITTTYRDYSDSVNRWNSLVDRYRGRSINHEANRIDWDNLDAAYRDRVNWAERYNQARHDTKTLCTQAPPTINNITIQAPPEGYSTPRSGGGSVALPDAPPGAPRTGDAGLAPDAVPAGR